MVDVLVQFADSVPQPLTGALVELAPFLSVAARSARLVEWSDDWYSSWLVVAGWWILCLAAPIVFRYGLPLVTAVTLTWIVGHRRSAPLVTESVLQKAVADLCTLRDTASRGWGITAVNLRAAAMLTVPWVILTYFMSTRIILAVMGTIMLTCRAPWARVLCSVVWRSAFVRTCVYHIETFITGQALPKYVISSQPTSETPSPVPSLRFLFTVYENQRWWMGLDWTAALLPNERPSWSTPSLHAVTPPSGFRLPDATTTYLPSADGRSRIQRTATWKWEEGEWRVVVHKEGNIVSRVERRPPCVEEAPQQPSAQKTPTNRLLRAAASKLTESGPRESRASSVASPPSASASTADLAPSDDTDQNHSDEPQTDPDGWIYTDNKWENQSHRGGLGKYTRYRRWSRVAVVTESVQVVGPGDLGVHNSQKPPQHPSSSSPPSSPITSTNSTTPASSEPKTQSTEAQSPLTPPPPSPVILSPDPETSPLRQRLRAALSKSSIPPPSS